MNPNQQTVGIKIAQPGYSTTNCPDYDLIFNSSWPSLAIVFDQTLTVTTDTTGYAPVPHNLGFVPLSMGWQFTDSTLKVSQGRIFPSVDINNVYVLGSPSTTYYVNVKCYNLDITQQQSYTYLQPAAQALPYDANYGIKVVKANEQINNTDLRAFILHSRATSPQVLAVVTQESAYTSTTTGGTVITYQNPQSYTPWAFGYGEITTSTHGNVYQWAPPVSQSYPAISFTLFGENTVGMNLINYANGTGNGSIIILRDPLFTPNTIDVTY